MKMLVEKRAAAAAAERIRWHIDWQPSNADVFLTKPGPFVDLVVGRDHASDRRNPELSTTGGTSDARFIKDYCPVLEFGLVGQTMHQVDERTPVSDLVTLTAVYRRLLDGTSRRPRLPSAVRRSLSFYRKARPQRATAGEPRSTRSTGRAPPGTLPSAVNQVGDGRALVDLVHWSDRPDRIPGRTVVLMKRASEVPPVVESSGLRPVTLRDRAHHEIDERPRLGEETRRRSRAASRCASGYARCGCGRSLLDQHLSSQLGCDSRCNGC